MSTPVPASVAIDAVLVGRAVDYTRPGSRSAIAKQVVDASVDITPTGVRGDEQGDPRVHGGIDKAIHHYPRDHYPAWREEIGARAVLEGPGAFGENLSTRGWTESDVCIGDVVEAGSALLEISQGRQPCWKLSDRFGVADMALRVQQSGRTGWYYRVLRPGRIVAGDLMRVRERPHPDWPLQRLMRLLHARTLDPGVLDECLALPLVPSWRKLIERRLQSGRAEDWTRRLQGEPPA